MNIQETGTENRLEKFYTKTELWLFECEKVDEDIQGLKKRLPLLNKSFLAKTRPILRILPLEYSWML